MAEEWLNEKEHDLKDTQLRKSALIGIRDYLNQVENLTNAVLSHFLRSDALFEILNEQKTTLDTDEIDKILDILQISLAHFQIDTANVELPNILRRALTSEHMQLRTIALNRLHTELEHQKTNGALAPLPSNELLFHVLDELIQKDTNCSAIAIKILADLMGEHLTEPEMQNALLNMLQQNEIVRCRLYELAVLLAKQSAEQLAAIEFILDAALAELDNEDVLLQSNILEILVGLAEQKHGMQFMEHRNVFHIISNRIKYLEENPLDGLLVPSIMKFFGKIASMQPQKIITGYPHMIECLFNCLLGSDSSLLPPAMDTLANLADSAQGKLLLEKHYSKNMEKIFKTYATHLKSMPAHLKERLFSTLNVIYSFDRSVTPDVSELLHKWLRHMTISDNILFLLDYCRTPFLDIKLGCLNFIKAIVNYEWGIVCFKNTPCFLEYMLDRKIEFEKSVKLIKWEIIRILSLKSDAFDMQTALTLNRYVKDGPYFATSDMNIATEGQ